MRSKFFILKRHVMESLKLMYQDYGYEEQNSFNRDKCTQLIDVGNEFTSDVMSAEVTLSSTQNDWDIEFLLPYVVGATKILYLISSIKDAKMFMDTIQEINGAEFGHVINRVCDDGIHEFSPSAMIWNGNADKMEKYDYCIFPIEQNHNNSYNFEILDAGKYDLVITKMEPNRDIEEYISKYFSSLNRVFINMFI